MKRFLPAYALLAMACCPLAATAAGISGNCVHDGRTARFVDGAAWAVFDEDSKEATGERLLVFGTYDVDTDALWRAPPLAREDAFRMQDVAMEDSARLQLTLDPDGTITQLYLWLSPGNNISRGGTGIGTYAPRAVGDGRIAGTYAFSDEPDDPSCELTFDVALLGDPATAPPLPGTPLPADGGEPGRVYLATQRALLAGDLDALAKLLPADRVAQMQEARKRPEFAAQLAFMQELAPRDVRIRGGRRDGDRAWLEFTATEGGQPRAGTVEMRHADGRWYIVSESTRAPD